MDEIKTRRGRGRPPKGDTSKEKASKNRLMTYFSTADDLREVQQAADLRGQTMSAFANEVLLREARAILMRDQRRKAAEAKAEATTPKAD